MPTNYVLLCTFKGTLFCFCHNACGSHNFTDMLHFFYRCTVHHIATSIAFSADVDCLYVEVTVLGIAIRGRPSSKNTSGPLSDESLSEGEVVFTLFLF